MKVLLPYRRKNGYLNDRPRMFGVTVTCLFSVHIMFERLHCQPVEGAHTAAHLFWSYNSNLLWCVVATTFYEEVACSRSRLNINQF